MNKDILFMFKLISSVVLEEEPPKLSENINWTNILRISVMHNIANIIAYGIIKGKYEIPPEIKNQFEIKLYERLTVSDNQNAQIKKLFKAFDENNIDYMPLKGILLQDLYPSRDMRFMADVDILIRTEQKEDFDKIMLSQNFVFKVESNHEYVYSKKPYISVELHKYLIPSYNDDMYAYYGDGWKCAVVSKDNTNRYEISPEDNFIYIFTHYAKHYRDSGVGIKAVLDIWLYLKKNLYLDESYIKEQLLKLNLDKFYDNTMILIKCWFDDCEFNETTKLMTEFIITSGTFGTTKNQMSAKSIRESNDIQNAGRFKYLKAVFPGVEKLKVYFPVLEKYPFLLPVIWFWRIIRLVLFRTKNIKKHKQIMDSVDSEHIVKYNKHMKDVGLDIYNGRKNG